jgi:hypothetical protein
MGIISWVIVFVPFIFMSIIVAILLYVFGLDPATGKLNFKCENTNTLGGNLVYSTTTIQTPKKEVKYVDVSYSETPSEDAEPAVPGAPFWSSDPQFE